MIYLKVMKMHRMVLVLMGLGLSGLCSCSQSDALQDEVAKVNAEVDRLNAENKKNLERDDGTSVCSNHVFYLTDQQIVEKQKLALQGNKEAAKALYFYYNFFSDNRYLSNAWLYIGASLGDDVCISNMNDSIDQKYFSRDCVFIIPDDQLSEMKKQALTNPVDCFLLYKHYMWSNDKAEAQKLLPALKHFGVNEKMLKLGE